MQKNYFYKKSKLILGLIIYLFSISIFAQQQKIVLKGKVTNGFNIPLNETDIFLREKSDSTKIFSTTTDENGFFELNINIQEKPVYLIINNPHEGTFRKNFDFITNDIDLGTININSTVYDLNEVVFTNSQPMVMKNDTIEYNTNSYKVKPNANMENLLQELPGFEINDEGSILINGKIVKEILIDGETFFGTDGKVALENLPAEVIKKIQVSDFKNRNQKFSGEKSTSKYASINISLKEDKNKGFMLKAIGGYGSDNRYEANLIANYFKEKKRFSLIGSSTNIASSGMVNGEGSHGLREMERNNNTGITTHTTVGLNYNDQLNKNLKIGVDYRLNHLFNKNDKYIKNENLNPDNVYTTITNSNTRVETYGNNVGTNFDWTKNNTKIYIYPQFSNSSSVNSDLSKSESKNAENTIRNTTNSNTNNKSNSTTFSNLISIYQKFKNNSYLEFNSTISILNKNNDRRELANAIFYDTPEDNTYRNVNTKGYEKNNLYDLDIKYTIPITDSIRIAVGSIYNHSYTNKNDISLNYNDNTGKFDDLNTDLTIYFQTKLDALKPYAQFLLSKSKFYSTINLATTINKQNNLGNYKSVSEKLIKNNSLPEIKTTTRYENGNNTIMFIYNYETSLPTAENLLKIENKSSLTTTITGNPDLNPNRFHDINLMLGNFNKKNQQGFNLNLQYIYNESSIVNSTLTNEDYIREITYKNVRGNYNLAGFLFYNKQFKKGLNRFRFNIGFSSTYSLSQVFNENIQIKTYLTNLSPSFKFNWDCGNKFTISPSYKIMYVSSEYVNYPVSGQNNVTHNITLNTFSKWIKHLTWINHLNYNYNSSISSEFKKDFLIWNSSIMYRFFNDKLEAGIKIYDILKQNNNFTRIISDQYISDEKNSILTQFIMLSLTFNLNKFGQKISDKNKYPPKENDDFSEKMLSLNN